MNFYTKILADNLDGVGHFIERLTSHKGILRVEKLHVVDYKNNSPFVREGNQRDVKSIYFLATGGEVVNSFSPLYEVGYFFICMFLAGVGTAVMKKKLLAKYRRLDNEYVFSSILSDLSALTEEEIIQGMKKPVIGIISNMDTDVVPLRYNKHQLWQLVPSVLTKRVAEITKAEYGKSSMPVLNSQYWTKRDQEIAVKAMQVTSSLKHAKIIQYHLVLQIFFAELGIDIKDVPIFFNFVPKEEIIVNGADNSLLKIIIALHKPEERIKYRKITGIDNPWILTKACPRCGEGDKRILSSKLMGDGLTVKVHCKPYEFTFRNEYGDKFVRKGCGYQFTFKVPTDHESLYKFLKKEDFSLHFATRELVTILRDCTNNPIGLVVTDLGVLRRKNGSLKKDPFQVQGYGDNLEMLTSALALQHFFIQEKVAGQVAKQLKKNHLVANLPVMLFGYDRQTELVDDQLTTLNKVGQKIPVSDTSALKALEKGISVKEMLKKAVHIHSFSLEELFLLRGKSLETLEDKISMKPTSSSQHFQLSLSGKIDQIKSKSRVELMK